MQNAELEPAVERAGGAAASDIGRIVPIGPRGVAPHIPPLSDYKCATSGWAEAEYRCYELARDNITVGFWTGEPGSVSLDPWPYTEVCSILSGRIAIRDLHGGEIVFGPGEGFVVPKGWAGTWVTLEPASKFFILIE